MCQIFLSTMYLWTCIWQADGDNLQSHHFHSILAHQRNPVSQRCWGHLHIFSFSLNNIWFPNQRQMDDFENMVHWLQKFIVFLFLQYWYCSIFHSPVPDILWNWGPKVVPSIWTAASYANIGVDNLKTKRKRKWKNIFK